MAPEVAARAARELDPRRWIGLFAALLAPFLGVVDFFVINLALPPIQREFDASFADAELAIAGYAVAYAVCVVTGGRLGDTHGRKRIFRTGMGAFVVTSVGCALAPNIHVLLLSRVLQGIAAALMFPQVLSMIQVNFPEHERARAYAYLGMSVGLASITGQVLGGVLTDLDVFGLGWRMLFLINVPLGIVAMWVTQRNLHESRRDQPPTLDWGGVALATLGLTLFMLPLVKGHELGWPPWLLASLCASPLVMYVFWRHERATSSAGRDPLIDPLVFRLHTFRLGLCVVAAYFAGMTALFLNLTMHFQKGLGLSPSGAGHAFLPYAVAILVSSLIASRFAQRWRGAFLAGGLALTTLAMLALVVAVQGSARTHSSVTIAIFLALFGIGHGCLSPILYSAILARIPPRAAGAASGVLSTVQQVAASLGLAAIGLVQQTALGQRTSLDAYAGATARALSCNCALIVISAGFAWRMSRARVEPE